MCLNPISILNPSKYINVHYRNRYLLQVPCGKCAQCQTNKSNEWYYRTYYHCLDCWNNGGFVYFDTLTYAPKYLPHLSDFFQVKSDFPCFNGSHLRNFVQALKLRLKRKYMSDFEFFISYEYGTSPKCTHRPHYHILAFVKSGISPLQFSKEVSSYWKYGRTDGYPYQCANYVMNHNVLDNSSPAAMLRACRYVSKYVQKSSMFESEINRRIDCTMNDYAERMPLGWSESIHYKRLKERLKRYVCQKHRQSTQFGAAALADMDIAQVIQDGYLVMPDYEKVKLKIPLPMYYKRKLFYMCEIVNGAKTWIPTKDGEIYLNTRLKQNEISLANRLDALAKNIRISVDSKALAHYVTYVRGRFNGYKNEVPVTEIIKDKVTHYNYITRSDIERLGKASLYYQYRGNVSQGYLFSKEVVTLSIKKFISRFVMLFPQYERQLELLYNANKQLDIGRQNAFVLRQRLNNVYKFLQL